MHALTVAITMLCASSARSKENTMELSITRRREGVMATVIAIVMVQIVEVIVFFDLLKSQLNRMNRRL
jgi:hypothetical protein